ncbi:MAG: glucose-6-phosphate isomerase, partial [Clostridia bacterium]|nr:glucose-6-phosphate isomerase [Clostridia bacterium]
MMSFGIDFTNCGDIFERSDFLEYKKRAVTAHDMLINKTGKSADMTLWHTLPVDYDKSELERIKLCAKRIKDEHKVFVVIGIGGSYAGARGAIDFIHGSNYNLLCKNKPKIFYAGCNLSPDSIAAVIDMIGDDDFCVNVISKSGTTLEPAIAFRIFKDMLIERYGKEGAVKRIYATTDPNKGALRHLADEDGYESFCVPDGIGGRYSVLTAVGLLPIAVSGIDIDEVMCGARDAYDAFMELDFEKNVCLKYAALRNYLYDKGKNIEIFSSFEPDLHSLGEWLKQLFAESEGKGGQGIFPVYSTFSTDLHSIGQYIQDGTKNQFETFLWPNHSRREIDIKHNERNFDNLNYLSKLTLSEINKRAMIASAKAHRDGGVPNLTITFPRADAYSFGYL